MHRIGRTFVRLSSHNCLGIDQLRRRRNCSRDRLVNEIVADYLDGIYADLCRESVHRRRRSVA